VLPDTADGVSAPVLREAVTNILRHSSATAGTIKASEYDGCCGLKVSNDGPVDRWMMAAWTLLHEMRARVPALRI